MHYSTTYREKMVSHHFPEAEQIKGDGEVWCRGCDLNTGTTKDKALNLAPLAKLGYPCL
jgi:hypothetical protein